MNARRMLPLMLCLALLFPLLSRGAAEQETPDAPLISVPCGKDGVEEFMAAFAQAYPTGIVNGYREDEAHCYNVTPESVAAETDIRIFKFSDSCGSFALVEGQVCVLCELPGGYGFLNAVPWNDDDGQTDLLVASSRGSGIHRTEISVFNRAKKTARVILSTLYCPFEGLDPQSDLLVTVEPAEAGEPEVILRQVEVLHPADYDFAHLQYRMTDNTYQLQSPIITRVFRWSGEAAAPRRTKTACGGISTAGEAIFRQETVFADRAGHELYRYADGRSIQKGGKHHGTVQNPG